MRRLPPITKNLLIINVLAFLAYLVFQSRGVDLNNELGLHYFQSEKFMPYQFITYMFLHGGWEHIFFNMFALWMFGGIVEQTVGAKRFIIYYFVCGIGAGICQEVAQFIHFQNLEIIQETYHGEQIDCVLLENYVEVELNNYLSLWTCVGASGAIYGILLAFGMYYPNERMFIIPIPFPIKAKYLVVGYAVIECMATITSNHDGIAHIAHLGGMVFGLLLILYWRYKDNRNQGGGAVYVSFDSYNRNY